MGSSVTLFHIITPRPPYKMIYGIHLELPYMRIHSSNLLRVQARGDATLGVEVPLILKPATQNAQLAYLDGSMITRIPHCRADQFYLRDENHWFEML